MAIFAEKMMSKLKLLAIVVLTVVFLLSLWAVPAAMTIIALTLIHSLWIKVALCVDAVLWLLLLRPWSMFRDPRFGQFISDMRRAINALIS